MKTQKVDTNLEWEDPICKATVRNYHENEDALLIMLNQVLSKNKNVKLEIFHIHNGPNLDYGNVNYVYKINDKRISIEIDKNSFYTLNTKGMGLNLTSKITIYPARYKLQIERDNETDPNNETNPTICLNLRGNKLYLKDGDTEKEDFSDNGPPYYLDTTPDFQSSFELGKRFYKLNKPLIKPLEELIELVNTKRLSQSRKMLSKTDLKNIITLYKRFKVR
ncbi:MAG: hypothetical protein WC413_01860 [Candidatus Nanoarchaeia archaeon]